MRRKLFSVLLFVPAGVSPAAAQNPDLILNPGSSYVDVGRGIDWGTQFNRAYVIVPNSPNASVCIYIVNNNPTSSHTFTLQVFQSADSRAQDFTNNQGRFNAVPAVGTVSPVPAGSMTSAFTQSTAAAKVAIKFSGASSAAGSPDNADIFLVQTTAGSCGSAASALQVQGTTIPGAATIGNPVLIGGQDFAGNAQFFGVSLVSDTSGFNLNSFPIGGTNNNLGSTYASYSLPRGGPKGPLAVNVLARQSTAGSLNDLWLLNGMGPCITNTGCSSLIVRDAGFAGNTGLSNQGVSATFPIWSDVHTQGITKACTFQVSITSVSGTTPTLDLFVQDSPDNTIWNDRMHFAQITAVSKQWGSISGFGAGKAPIPMTDGTMTAGSFIDGPLAQYGRWKLVIAGTSPAFTGTLWLSCL